MSKVALARTDGKGKKLVLKTTVSVKGLPATANVVGLWRQDTNEIVGHTNVSTDGSFTTEFHMDHFMSADLAVKFCVYSAVNDPIGASDFVGAYETTLAGLFKGKNQEQPVGAGSIVIKTVVLADPNAPKKEKKAPVEQQKKMTKEEKDAAAAAKLKEKAVKAAFKEGGKKGQDLCGMSTFGVHFFLTSMDSMGDDWDLMEQAMQGMNKPVDPEGDDRKGGAADIAKILFCAGDGKLIMHCNVPKEHKAECSALEFLTAVCEPVQGVIIEQNEFFAKAECVADPEKDRFPLKLKDQAIAAGFKFLRARSLILDDDDSDDDINFADDCGVDLNAGGEGDY